MYSKIVLALFVAAVAQINGHPWFGKKDDSESKPLFGLPSLPFNPIKSVVENAENMKEKISNVADDAMGSLKLDEVKNMIPIPEQLGGANIMDGLEDIASIDKITNILGNDISDKEQGPDLDNEKEQKKPTFELPSMLNPIKVVSENVGNIQDKLVNNEIKNLADNVLENLHLDEAKNKIEDTLGGVIDTAKENVENIQDKLVNNEIKNKLEDTLGGVIDTAKENVGGITNGVMGQGGKIVDMAKGAVDNVKDQVSNVVATQAALGKLSKFIAYVASWFS